MSWDYLINIEFNKHITFKLVFKICLITDFLFSCWHFQFLIQIAKQDNLKLDNVRVVNLIKDTSRLCISQKISCIQFHDLRFSINCYKKGNSETTKFKGRVIHVAILMSRNCIPHVHRTSVWVYHFAVLNNL